MILDEVPAHIFNTNVTIDIFLHAVKEFIVKEMEVFHRNKEAELQAQLDERIFQVEQTKRSLSTVNPEDEDIEVTKEQLETTLANYEDGQKSLEAKLKALEQGMLTFKDLNTSEIDLVDSETGNRLNMTSQPRERAMKLLSQGSVYNVVKLGKS